MTQLPDFTNEVTEIADEDWIYVWDASTPSDPDAKARGSRLRPPGDRITNYIRYESTIVIPVINAATEGSATIAVAGAAVGDHVVFNMQDDLPADMGVTMVRVSAANTVQVRFRNLHTTNNYAGGTLACTALVIRSAAA